MSLILCLLIGCLFGAGIFLLLRPSLFKVALGVAMIGHAVNLVILTAGGLTEGVGALIPEGSTTLSTSAADPLPQALILTAIVIGFGMQAFLVVLIRNGNRYRGLFESKELSEDLQ